VPPSAQDVVLEVPALLPGVGAVAAQGVVDTTTRDQVAALVAEGELPLESVFAVVNAADTMASLRQYGVATLERGTGAYSGAGLPAWAGAVSDEEGTVQGNILVDEAVAEAALAAFHADADCAPLSERLLRALEAAAAEGGDSRCSPEQTARRAVLVVAGPEDDPDAPAIEVATAYQPEGGPNPVALLREAYDTAYGDPDACTGGSSSSGGASTGHAETSEGPDDTATSSGGSSSSGEVDASSTGAMDGTTSTPVGGESSSSSSSSSPSGCVVAAPPASWTIALLLLPVLARRRRRSRYCA
jgi:uncharacterized Ntn-hydrolase superfamily protein